MSNESNETKTWTGSCHCGAVTFEVDATDEVMGKPMACNCSMCGRSGAWMAFVPEESFRVLSGRDELRDYQFGKRHIHHVFCPTCGLKPYSWGDNPEGGGTTFAVNLRCVDGIDLQKLEPSWYDGAAL